MTPDPSAIRFVGDRLSGEETLTYEDIAVLLPEGSGEMFSPSDYDVVPNQFDVLCGRKKDAYRHIGNRKFRTTIGMHCSRYQNTKSRSEKKRITDEIIALIQKCGGRFLRRDAKMNIWYKVSDEYTHEKVSHALRSAKDPQSRSSRNLRL